MIIICTIGVTFIGIMMNHLEIKNYLYLGTAISCMPFFLLGHFLNNTSILKSSKPFKRNLIIFSSSLLVALMIFSIYDSYSIKLWYWHNAFKGMALKSFYIITILLLICFLLLCKYIKKLPVISYLGRFSVIVLVTHLLMIEVLDPFLYHFAGYNNKLVRHNLLLYGIIMVSMFLVIPLCRKYLPYVTAQKSIFNQPVNKKEVVI